MKRNGYTLIELMLVLVLITLILGLTAVYFAGSLTKAKLNATGRELAALMRYARTSARMNMEVKAVTIDLDGRTYSLADRATKEIPANISIRLIDPVDGPVDRGKHLFLFHPNGKIEGGKILLSSKAKKLSIDIDPVTGVVLLKSSL
ncbi:MAG: prepilin-type N-terminal cleavage/methylation domain-containing protein [Syntrophaceae bacterium]|nr:prepilin-type N-terminal cleavage/methylation domain-containing protein [Syntrophaceae bacterium]